VLIDSHGLRCQLLLAGPPELVHGGWKSFIGGYTWQRRSLTRGALTSTAHVAAGVGPPAGEWHDWPARG
jgi:hypothetical protein